MGASSDVTDAGWLPKNRQIGLTGRAVAPRLYLSVGVRGAFEHLVGSVKAGVIAALNANERAPIFKAADVGLVGDWRETLPPLVGRARGEASLRLHEHVWGPGPPRRSSASTASPAHGGVSASSRRSGSTGLHVLALDLRGHGRSGWEEPWTIAQHVEDLLETAGGPAVWVGHSFGGRLVMELTARQPELVARAVLIDPALWVPPDFAQTAADEQIPQMSYATPASVEARAAGTGLGWLAHTPRAASRRRSGAPRPVAGRPLPLPVLAECVAAAYLEMAADPPPFESARVPTLLVLGRIPSSSAAARSGPIAPRSAICSAWSSSGAGTPALGRLRGDCHGDHRVLALEDPRAEGARGQLDGERRRLVLPVEDRVHLDDLERAHQARTPQ